MRIDMAHLYDHYAELIVEVADPEHLRPEALAGSERVHAYAATQRMELLSEL
jgi:hypothetical protein